VRRLVRVLLASALLFVGAAATSEGASAVIEPRASEVQFLTLLNQVRASLGLGEVARDAAADSLALEWSNHMADTFAGNGSVVIDAAAPSDCNRSALCHRPGLAGAIATIEPNWRAAAENIGTGGDVQTLHDAFVKSPLHYENMIGNYNRVGVGVVVRGARVWVTFDFLRGPALPAASVPSGSVPGGSVPDGSTNAPLANRVVGPTIAKVTETGAAGRLIPVEPRRLLDTRDGTGGTLGRVAGGTHVEVDLSHAPDRPAGAVAVMLNVTATEPVANGYLTVYPCNGAIPLASNVNYTVGHTVPNSVEVGVPASGLVCVYSQVTTHVVVDLAGWFTSSSNAPGIVTAAPNRLLDSRNVGGQEQSFTVPLSSVVPAGAQAVLVNVTVTDPVAGGYVTAYPCGAAVPLASNLNFSAGQTVPNLATVKIGTDRSICFYAKVPTHLVVDLEGWFDASGAGIRPVVPNRFLDTRDGTGGWRGQLGVGQSIDLPLAGAAGIPGNAQAVLMNITVTDAEAAGYLTVYPCGSEVPLASNLNFTAGQTAANLVAVKLGSGKVCLYASQRTEVIADLAGYVA